MEIAPEFKSSKKPTKASKTAKQKKASKRAIKDAALQAKKSMDEFDRTEHNRKIAKIRGPEWKHNLKWSKMGGQLSPIALARLDKNLSQRDMVRETTVGTQVTYGRIENGIRKATVRNAKSIACSKSQNQIE